MFVELIDLLRCPNLHADSWLVAAATRTVGRHVVEGTLGCPVCEAEFAIHDGVADFGIAPDAHAIATPLEGIDEERAMRTAALLGLTSAGGTVLLGGSAAGERGMIAALLADMAGVRVLVLDPLNVPPLADQLSALRGGGGVPLAAGSLRGAVLDAHTADALRLAAIVRALAPRGRLVAPASVALPNGVTEMALDAWEWLAERDADSAVSSPIELRRRDR